MDWMIIAIGIVLLIIIIWCISISNRFNRLGIRIEESTSGIDVALTKRYDVLTKMIEVVKGYTKHEKEVFFKVVELRNNMTIKEKNEVNASMNDDFDKIRVLAEDYPELKASENFRTLQKAIVDVEEHLQAARRLYNSNVSAYNELLLSFPSSIIASLKGLKRKDFFTAKEEEKDNVNVNI